MAKAKKDAVVQDAAKPDAVNTARVKKGSKATASKPAGRGERGGTWIPITCTKADLAILLNISMRALSDLDKRGLLVRGAKNGTYQTVPSMHMYIDRMRATAAGRLKEQASPAAEERFKREQLERKTAELKYDQMRGEVLSLSEVEESWSEFAGKVKSAVLSIPTKSRAAIPHLTAHDAAQIKTICKDLLNDLADEVRASVVSGAPDDLES